MAQESTPDALEKFRKKCLARGANSIKGLGRTFRIMDDDHSRTLNVDEFRTGLADYGLTMDDNEVKDLFDYFDKDKCGSIDLNEFIVSLKPPMSQARKDIVLQAFSKVDKSGDGKITKLDLKGLYDAKKHPKFLNGEWTETEVFEDFLKSFENDSNRDGQVTQEEFLDYYGALGAYIDNDAYFDLMIRNAWKL